MRRREFITLLGGAAAAWPLAAWAQQSDRTYRLGFLIPTSRQTPAVAAFFDELRLNGFIEGQNLTVVPGGFDVRNEELAERAAALVKAAPDAIIAGPELPLHALLEVTRTVPLIGMTEDMLAAGLAASLARPVAISPESACSHPMASDGGAWRVAHGGSGGCQCYPGTTSSGAERRSNSARR